MIKKARYLIEGILVRCAYWFFSRVSFKTASDIGGSVFRWIGPFLPRSKVAGKNLERAMPEKGKQDIDIIIKDMWENTGRVIAEFPHMVSISREDLPDLLEIEGLEHIETVKKLNQGSIFVSGHLGNWELACRALELHEFPLILVYRKGNNPVLDNIIQQTRDHYQPEAIPKGGAGARQLVQCIKAGKHVGILIDQKMNDGIPVKFFGRDAMTGPAIARLALRFNCPIVPGRVVRIHGHKQKLIIYPPLELTDTGDQEADVLSIMTGINSMLEEWIREYPSQWIWIHNRWPKENH